MNGLIGGNTEQVIGREGETATLLRTSSVFFQLVRWLRQLNRSTKVNHECQKRSFIGHFLNLFKILSGLIKSCYKTNLKNKISKQMV